MHILVCICGEVSYEGDADEFLEMNSYDEEIEEALNELSLKQVGDKIRVYGGTTNLYTIEKLENEIL